MNTAELSDEQRAILVQFRESVKDCALRDDYDEFLLRWLVARNFNVQSAERMLRQSLDWRKIHNVDNIVGTWDPPEVLTKYYSMTLFGYDKFGSPLWIAPHGRCDLIGLSASVSTRDFVKYHAYLHEISYADMKSMFEFTGKRVTQVTILYDLEHLSWRQVTHRPMIECCLEIVKMSEAHFPETLRRVFVINVPKIFYILYALIKPFLHPNTVKKICIFGHNTDQWKSALLEEIDAEHLPIHYGGSASDPDGDPMCPSKLCCGGEVPESYYLPKIKPQPTQDMESCVISRGSKKTVEMDIKVPNSTLKWRFMTESGDLGFHIYYLEENKKVDVIPMNRVDCHVCQEEGIIGCPQTVTYVIEFDNSFSYLRSKKIWYSVTVTEPIVEDS